MGLEPRAKNNQTHNHLEVGSPINDYTLIPRASSKEGGIRGEMATSDHAHMTPQAHHLLSSVYIPHPYGFIAGARGYKATVQCEGAAPYIAAMADKSCQYRHT